MRNRRVSLTDGQSWRLEWRDYMICARAFRDEAAKHPVGSCMRRHYQGRSRAMMQGATDHRQRNMMYKALPSDVSLADTYFPTQSGAM